MPTNPTLDYNVSIDTNIGSQRQDYEYSDQLIHQRESAFPFVAFSNKMIKESSKTSTIYWFDTRPAPEVDSVSTTVAASGAVATSIAVVVATPKAFKVGHIIEFPNAAVGAGETNIGYVSAVVVGTSTLTVLPADPTLKICGSTAGDVINIMSSSYEQGSGTTVPFLTRPIRGSNTSQILRDSYQIAKTEENVRLYAAPERARARMEKEIRHLVDLNKTLLFGKDITPETTYQTNVRQMTKGFENFVSSNVIGYGASLTLKKLTDAMTQIHENAYGAEGNMNSRLVFCSSRFMGFINELLVPQLRFTNNIVTSWGANVTRLEWSGWVWNLVLDPTMTKFRQGQAFVMQPRYIKYKPLRDTLFRANIQNPEVDYVKDEFLTEPNLEVRLEEAHAILKQSA